MGHKDIKMTLRYSHLSKTHLKEAASTLDKKFTTVLLPRLESKKIPTLKPFDLVEPAIGIEPTTR